MKKSEQFSQLLEKLFPKVEPFLIGETNFQYLVSVILSAQTTDKVTNNEVALLFEKVKTPEEMVKLGEKKIYEFVKKVNYSKKKANYIYQTAKIICEKYDGVVPKNREDLIKLKGVGGKTAGVFLVSRKLGFAFPVDTHVSRVAKAFGFTKEKNPDKIEKDLKKVFPKKQWRDLHLRMILYGRNFLKAKDVKNKKNKKDFFLELEENARTF